MYTCVVCPGSAAHVLIVDQDIESSGHCIYKFVLLPKIDNHKVHLGAYVCSRPYRLTQ